MAYTMKNGRTPPTTTGEGELSYKGFKGQVAYEIIGALAGLRQGGASLRGSFMTTEEIADNAFKACDGHLRLADGKEYRITMVGYTPGTATGYFELKI
jgi:hypothetical protein